jgi:hypothetical protein
LFPISTTLLRLCFFASSSKLKQLRLGNLKSVGAQLTARFFCSAQILAVERKLALASAQFLAED